MLLVPVLQFVMSLVPVLQYFINFFKRSELFFPRGALGFPACRYNV